MAGKVKMVFQSATILVILVYVNYFAARETPWDATPGAGATQPAAAAAHFTRKDPGPFVLDEAAGVCLTWLALPGNPDAWSPHAWAVVSAVFVFLAFRVFDILKPPPARQLEKLPEGWGILADDLMAAVYANLACQLVLRGVFGGAGINKPRRP
jgi:phosphatidylglycerophosphatase A